MYKLMEYKLSNSSGRINKTKRIGIGLSIILLTVIFVYAFTLQPSLLNPKFSEPSKEIPTAIPEQVGMSSEILLRIDTVMQKYIDAGKIQGAVAVVARRGKVAYFKAHGLMDVELDRVMEQDAIFRMASSSKPVLGVAAMMMIEEGLIDPADEVAKYIPEFKDMQVAVLKEPGDKDVSPQWLKKGQVPEHRLVPAERLITIHHLLTHTSGLASSGLGSAVSTVKGPAPKETLADHAPRYATMALDFQPGTRWAYSPGAGLDIVARIIEIVSGMPYDEFIAKRIFEPLGMDDTHFNLPPEKESRRVVIPGIDGKAKGWNIKKSYISASGGLSSTAEDYLRFEQMLANEGTLFGKRLLSPESIAMMTSNYIGGFDLGKSKISGGFGYTVAIVLDPVAEKSGRSKGSFGWGGAYGTISWTDPEEEISAVLMVQQSGTGVVKDFEQAIREAILE
jgi:CubicO group peptidase (beta-lactamase class C family)